eukprot:TRINITY_DN11408_c0_g1_i9.p1 TRINITY_DN11408_c0_g1~~TRINITY_DN11408_c0_g1_i9.p1  ORF type:complete len:355 (-),score=69.38 TRINITY_DN11408_c0_g1_i9:880-1944(-)
MTRFLPASLFSLFQARPPLEYIPPPTKRKMPPYSGVASLVQYFEDPQEHPPPPPLKIKNKEQRRAEKRKLKQEKELAKIEEELKNWDPHSNPKATDEAYKTLFVCRMNYATTDHQLYREFEQYGPIKQVRIIRDLEGKPRGYAFIEYEREKDMRLAYKEADAKKIDGFRVLVDVERGRTVKDWKPRRFGGGLGGTRTSGDKKKVFSGRVRSVEENGEDLRYQDRRSDNRRFSGGGGGGGGSGGSGGSQFRAGRNEFRDNRHEDLRYDNRRDDRKEDWRDNKPYPKRNYDHPEDRRDNRRRDDHREDRQHGDKREERHRERRNDYNQNRDDLQEDKKRSREDDRDRDRHVRPKRH